MILQSQKAKTSPEDTIGFYLGIVTEKENGTIVDNDKNRRKFKLKLIPIAGDPQENKGCFLPNLIKDGDLFLETKVWYHLAVRFSLITISGKTQFEIYLLSPSNPSPKLFVGSYESYSGFPLKTLNDTLCGDLEISSYQRMIG